jgi:hypothetical protein
MRGSKRQIVTDGLDYLCISLANNAFACFVHIHHCFISTEDQLGEERPNQVFEVLKNCSILSFVPSVRQISAMGLADLSFRRW